MFVRYTLGRFGGIQHTTTAGMFNPLFTQKVVDRAWATGRLRASPCDCVNCPASHPHRFSENSGLHREWIAWRLAPARGGNLSLRAGEPPAGGLKPPDAAGSV